MEEQVLSRRVLFGELPDETATTEPGALSRGVSVIICTYRRARSLDRFLASLAEQDRTPDRLIVVDASPDDESEIMMMGRKDLASLGDSVWYFRVGEPLRGLTRQRNFGLRWVATDLVAFFDDDIVLGRGCLSVMEKIHRSCEGTLAGVAGFLDGGGTPPDMLWRVRKALHMVADLRPGSYQRSGMSVPWAFQPRTDAVVEGDYLPGGATMWRTSILLELGFNESFAGYGQGEDLEFSLRAGRKGKLAIAGEVKLQHLHESSGRPDHFKIGYMAIHNRYEIHRTGLDGRTAGDIAWFVYTWSLDSLMLARHLIIPSRIPGVVQEWGGRAKAAFDLLRGK